MFYDNGVMAVRVGHVSLIYEHLKYSHVGLLLKWVMNVGADLRYEEVSVEFELHDVMWSQMLYVNFVYETFTNDVFKEYE